MWLMFKGKAIKTYPISLSMSSSSRYNFVMRKKILYTFSLTHSCLCPWRKKGKKICKTRMDRIAIAKKYYFFFGRKNSWLAWPQTLENSFKTDQYKLLTTALVVLCNLYASHVHISTATLILISFSKERLFH